MTLTLLFNEGAQATGRGGFTSLRKKLLRRQRQIIKTIQEETTQLKIIINAVKHVDSYHKINITPTYRQAANVSVHSTPKLEIESRYELLAVPIQTLHRSLKLNAVLKHDYTTQLTLKPIKLVDFEKQFFISVMNEQTLKPALYARITKNDMLSASINIQPNIKNRVLRVLAGERRPTLERTRTSIEGDHIESKLNRKLGELALQLAGTDPKTLSRENKQVIINIIHGLVQEAYFTGQEYADKVKGEIKPVDSQDIETIKALTWQAVVRFFDLFEPDLLEKFRVAQNVTAPVIPPNLGITPEDIDKVDVSKKKLTVPEKKTHGFNNKEVRKLKLEDREHAKKIYDLSDAEFDELERQQDLINSIVTSIGLLSSVTAIMALNQGTLSNATRQVEFVTRRDDRVCQICESLDGFRYDVDPITHIIDGPLIPDDTHINCRCRYLLIDDETGEVLVG